VPRPPTRATDRGVQPVAITEEDAARLLAPAGRGSILRVHLQPGSRSEGAGGVHGDALKISVRAPAQDGRANQALLALLARRLGVPLASLSLVSGWASRQKRVLFEGLPTDELARRLASPDG
jgi:uncharacterized protein (TIGR00251 family)